MPKLLPGELVIAEYENGGFVNQWAVVTAVTGIEAGEGRKVAAGYTDVLYEGSAAKFTDNRANVAGGVGIKKLKDAGFYTQPFSGKNLAVLKVVNATDTFNSSGTKIGTLPAGTEIGIETGSAGYSNRHLMSVNAFKDANGVWQFLDQATYSYGFINVQQGFGLKMFNSVRAIETAENVVAEPTLNWAEVKAVLLNDENEAYLRSITTEDREAIVTKVKDFFAVIDLNKGVLGDGSIFFNVPANKDFVSRTLGVKGYTDAKTKFDAEASSFLAQFS